MIGEEKTGEEWVKHDGKGLPVDGSQTVMVKFRDGWSKSADQKYSACHLVGMWSWCEKFRHGSDIVAYRVVKP